MRIIIYLYTSFGLSSWKKSDDFVDTGVCRTNKIQTPWPESSSELNRPSNRRLSAKLVPTFWNRGVSRCQRD
jgi:hypothetical protein